MKTMKKLLALFLALTIVLSLAACGAPAQNSLQSQAKQSEELTRQDKELIAELIGGQDASNMTDQELDALIQQLVGDQEKENTTSGIVNLGTGEKPKQPAVDVSENKDAYDENGAMTKPFDQVYPELIEKEEVTFSGESILIKLASDKLTDGLKATGIGALEKIVPLEKAAWYEAKLTEGTDAKKALAAVRELDEVLLAEYNYEIQTASLDGYKDFGDRHKEGFDKNKHHKDQWHMHHCGIPDAYEQMETDGGDSSVVVAVIDSGVDYAHEDLKDNMWVNAKEIPDNGRDDDGNGYIDDYYGVDIISKNGNGGDTNGHGTHVAGIIAARNNNVGVLGIAYNVKIMSVKAAMHNGILNQADIAKAVLYAADNGAEVINMSFGGTACSIAVQDALAYAYTRCVLVASAGNSGCPNEVTDFYPPLPNYPAALTYVLGVMSVDETGTESVFTNWDAKAFNGVEYELYAPGENIMSTLPGNKYGYLSGTSMAAPVVSAFAAILRSEFTDRDKYPTKFIYGQLSATSEVYADCCNPGRHEVGGMPHNLPQVADLHAALTKLPKPEVNLQDYHLFDDPKYSDKNNGDGVIDAGETIALGLTLRNRWGMSKNTLVTIDTISQSSGLADPYFTIENPTVDYGSVGTYSTQDCGKVYTDELFTGWEDPFLIQVSEDCPNDYRFTLNVTITCENALDTEDTTVYTSEGTVDENVRAGYILPSIIEEDMVLTKDNLYIIPSSTVIQEGVTVRVEPGTHIQFWSDDADDPYADSYIAYLLVNGNFLVEGTKEEPVHIYPSQLMDHYGVEIGSSSTGYVSLQYADITNFFYSDWGGNHTGTGNNIDRADHCTFRNNYSGYMQFRALEGGVIVERKHSVVYIGRINATNCVFYKLGFQSDNCLYGTADRCIFVQCGIKYRGTYENCVFLGNSMVDQTNPDEYYNSSLTASTVVLPDQEDVSNNDLCVYYRPETGTTYVLWDKNDTAAADQYAQFLEKSLGGGYLKIETADELEWVKNNIATYTTVGIRWDDRQSSYVWYDGTPVDPVLFPGADQHIYGDTPVLTSSGKLYQNYYPERTYEIPGPILPTDITFSAYTVDIDLETTYQMAPKNTPVQLPVNAFLYESSDESVLTVSDTGLVTPVGKGTADVWVYSLDKAVKNRVTITVRDYVPLTDLKFPVKSAKLEVGTSAYAPCILTPADTTRHNVTYTSSDPDVVAANNGMLTAVGKGSATITATCEGITATIQVTTWVCAADLQRGLYNNYRTVESGDTSLPEVIASPANADLDLEWTSDDESILSVVNGKLIAKKAGTTYLYATDLNSGKQLSWRFYITSTAPVIQADMLPAKLSEGSMEMPVLTLAEGADTVPYWEILDPAVAKLEDGKIILTGEGITTLRVTDLRSGLTDEVFIYVMEGELPKVAELFSTDYSPSYSVARLEDGRVYYWRNNGAAPTLVCENAKDIDASYSTGGFNVIMEDSTVAYYNSSGSLHIYNDQPVAHLVLPEGMEPVSVLGCYYITYSGTGSAVGSQFILNKDGTVYAIGKNTYGFLGIGDSQNTTALTQVAINEPVKQIAWGSGDTTYYLTENNNLYVSGGRALKAATPVMIARDVTWLDNSGTWYVSDNSLYKFTYSMTEPEKQEGFDCTGWTVLDMTDNFSYFTGLVTKDNKIYDLSVMKNPDQAPIMSRVPSAKLAMKLPAFQYVVTEDGKLFGYGNKVGLAGMVDAGYINEYPKTVYIPLACPASELKVLQTNINENNVLCNDLLTLRFNKRLINATASIAENGTTMVVHKELDGEYLHIGLTVGFVEGTTYTLTISASGTTGVSGVTMPEDLVIEFTYKAPETEKDTTQPDTQEPEEILPDITPEEMVVYEAILDESIQRILTSESLVAKLDTWIEKTQYNPYFNGNAILNPISTDFEVSHWLRPLAPSVSAGTYTEIPFGGNYWGTTNETAIGLQMIDYTDFINYARLMYAPYLTEAPENTFPFVTSVKLFNKYGEEVTTVGNEEITFRVTFNRDMDTSIPLLVRFGSAYPYGDYEIKGQYVDARTWEGKYTLNTLIENGYQYFTISNGCSATDDLELQLDQYRFSFEIDTTAAQALIMQGTASDTGIQLRWTQDDFKTLMGYNVYRSTKEDGYYTRLNSTVIPADTMEWFDDTVEPGVVYYYNFTVVQTDLTESEPSGKIVIMSRDTMAPNIYHSPVTSAFTGSNLVLSATITDNLNIAYANLYYRIAGTDTWNIIRMNKLNDKYSAIIPAAYITVEGVEYYIEAFDGISYTYKGSAETPFTIAVQEAVGADALGDVDGDGVITNLDALLLLYTINDKYNMTAEEFARADLNGDGELWAAEALRILQYVSGVVGSVKM